MARSVRKPIRFHHLLLDAWPHPRRSGNAHFHRFGSYQYELGIVYRGHAYEAMAWRYAGPDVSQTPPVGSQVVEVRTLAIGTISEVCIAAVDFMRSVLAAEGKDPESLR
jgi:hypothetical protein